jgi:hypothetical protein
MILLQVNEPCIEAVNETKSSNSMKKKKEYSAEGNGKKAGIAATGEYTQDLPPDRNVRSQRIWS